MCRLLLKIIDFISICLQGGKTLIQTCLNSPDGFSPDDCVISDQDIAG